MLHFKTAKRMPYLLHNPITLPQINNSTDVSSVTAPEAVYLTQHTIRDIPNPDAHSIDSGGQCPDKLSVARIKDAALQGTSNIIHNFDGSGFRRARRLIDAASVS